MNKKASVDRVLMAVTPGANAPALFGALDGHDHEGVAWRVLEVGPGDDPVAALKDALAPHAEALSRGTAAVLVAYPDAADHIAAALSRADQPGPGAALARWHDLARGLLGLRRRTDGLTLALAGGIARAPLSFLQRAAQHLQVPLPAVEVSAADPGENAKIDAVAWLVARAAVSGSPAAAELTGELAARSLAAGPRGQGPEVDLDDLWARQDTAADTLTEREDALARARARIAELTGILSAREAERDEIRARLSELDTADAHAREMEAERDAAHARARELEAERDVAHARAQELEAERAAASETLRDLEQTVAARDAEMSELRVIERIKHQQEAMIALQTERLHDLQRHLDQRTLDAQATDASLKETGAERDRARAELAQAHEEIGHRRRREDDLMRSTSWRITRPLRAVRDVLRRG